MKKFLFGVILVGIIAGLIYYCSDGDDDYQRVRRWKPEKKDLISWEKLDTIVVGDGLFKLEYPDCFELDEEADDSSVTVTYKGITDLFLMANAEKNPYHWDADTLAEFIVRDRKAEDNDSIIMKDMHDGYFYLKGIMGSTRLCFYEQYVVYHELIFKLSLVYPSNMESKMENLFRLVHDWHPEIYEMFRTKKSYNTGERMSILKKGTGAHDYREFYIEERDGGCHLMVYDSCHHSRYAIDFHEGYLNDGAPGMYAFVSPDQRYVFVVCDINANSIGRLSTLLIYQVNTETLRVRFVNDCASVRLEKNSFSVASKTRCVTPDAEYTYQMDFNFKDITYDFNGKIKGVSKEYNSKRFRKRYGKHLINMKGLGTLRGQDDE
jgi:hypothetical protein